MSFNNIVVVVVVVVELFLSSFDGGFVGWVGVQGIGFDINMEVTIGTAKAVVMNVSKQGNYQIGHMMSALLFPIHNPNNAVSSKDSLYRVFLYKYLIS